jgi:hypothetical protein
MKSWVSGTEIMLEITGTTEYFDKIQNNRYSEN